MSELRVRADFDLVNAHKMVLAQYQTYLPQKNKNINNELAEMLYKNKRAKYPELREVSFNGTPLKFVNTDLMTINRVLSDLNNVKALYGVSVTADDINTMLSLAGVGLNGKTQTGKLIKSFYTGHYVDLGNKVEFNLGNRVYYLSCDDKIMARPVDTGSTHQKKYQIDDNGIFQKLIKRHHLDSASVFTMCNTYGWDVLEDKDGDITVVSQPENVRKAASTHIKMAQYYDKLMFEAEEKE